MHKHKLTDRHPVGGAVLTGFLMMLLREGISAVPMVAESLLRGSVSEITKILYMFIGAAAVYLLYRWWFSPEFKGVIKGSLLKGLKLCWPLAVYWVITLPVLYFTHSLELKPLALEIVSVSLTAGVVEELAFRHGVISTMMRNLDREDQIIRICVISSVFFGAFHALNIISGANVISSLVQVITAGCMGLFFSAVFIRTGNILPGIIAHALHDILAICTAPSVSSSGIITGGVGPSDIMDIALCLAIAFVSVKVILHPKYRKEIVALWDRVWGRNRAEAQVTEN